MLLSCPAYIIELVLCRIDKVLKERKIEKL